MSILRRNPERILVLMMNLVHVLVHALVMQESMNPVKIKVLNDEEDGNLPQEIP